MTADCQLPIGKREAVNLKKNIELEKNQNKIGNWQSAIGNGTTMANRNRAVVRNAIHRRIRRKVRGSTARPRLAIYRSTNHIYAQIIDDERGQTMVSASTTEKDLRGATGGNVEAAKRIGRAIAERARAAGIKQVVFDRGGYLYHGRVKALTDAAREAGLNPDEARPVASEAAAAEIETAPVEGEAASRKEAKRAKGEAKPGKPASETRPARGEAKPARKEAKAEVGGAMPAESGAAAPKSKEASPEQE